MNNIDIDRINELYHKSKSVGLGSLNRIDIQNKDGSIENLGEKYGKKLDKN